MVEVAFARPTKSTIMVSPEPGVSVVEGEREVPMPPLLVFGAAWLASFRETAAAMISEILALKLMASVFDPSGGLTK
jgi:hypothetical protein